VGGITLASRDPLDKARLVFAYTALAVWVVSWVLDAVFQAAGSDYDVPSSVPTIAIGAAVFMFGAKSFLDTWRGGRRNGNGNGKGTPA